MHIACQYIRLSPIKDMANIEPLFIDAEFDGHTLTLAVQLPSFYLKQMLQESLRSLDVVAKIDNRVEVVCCDGLSSLHKIPR